MTNVFGDFADAFNDHVSNPSVHLGGGQSAQVFVQPTAPTVEAGETYIWWQTGLGDGSGVTLWLEDGI